MRKQDFENIMHREGWTKRADLSGRSLVYMKDGKVVSFGPTWLSNIDETQLVSELTVMVAAKQKG